MNSVIQSGNGGREEDAALEKRHFRRAITFHAEVLNGGLAQYLTNAAGKQYRDTLESLEVIGATEQHDILRRAVDVLAPSVDLTERREVGTFTFGNDPVRKAISDLDNRYYASLESFYQRMVDFALANRESFEII